MKKNNELSQIKTALPYCLFKIDSRFFKLNDEYNTRIRFKKVKTTPNRRASESINIDTIRDRWGIDAYSDVFILTEKIFSDTEKAIKFTLNKLNYLIRTYRFYDKTAVHLVDLNPEDLFGFDYIYKGKGVCRMNLAGGIAQSDFLLNYQISNEIEKSLLDKFELPFWEELLMDSEQYIFQTNYRHSVLESVIALEYVVSKFIKKKCSEKDISKNDAQEFITKIGIAGNIKTTVKLLIDDKLPDDKVFKKCKSGITTRNNIVHNGKKDISLNEAQEVYKFSKKLIEFLFPYL